MPHKYPNIANYLKFQDDETFWDQAWWPDSVNEIFAMISGEDIRKLRDESPKNLATLVYKTVEKLQFSRNHPATIDQKKVF